MEEEDWESAFWISVRMCESCVGGWGDLRALLMVARRFWGGGLSGLVKSFGI